MSLTIERAIQVGTKHLRVIQRTDSAVAELSNRYTSRQFMLVEVWVVPQNEDAFTPMFLENAAAKNVYDLQGMIINNTHPTTLVHKLIDRFFWGLPVFEASWHASVLEIQGGPVISVVIGNQKGMDEMYNHGLRERPTAPS
jgi:hypothetical protein